MRYITWFKTTDKPIKSDSVQTTPIRTCYSHHGCFESSCVIQMLSTELFTKQNGHNHIDRVTVCVCEWTTSWHPALICGTVPNPSSTDLHQRQIIITSALPHNNGAHRSAPFKLHFLPVGPISDVDQTMFKKKKKKPIAVVSECICWTVPQRISTVLLKPHWMSLRCRIGLIWENRLLICSVP